MATMDNYDNTQFEIEDKKLIKYIGSDKCVRIPDGVTEIRAGAFDGKNFTELHIPGSVKRVALSAFKGCNKLKKVEIPLHLAKNIKILTKLFGANVAKIDFTFGLFGFPADVDALTKIRQELDKIHIDEDDKTENTFDIDFEEEDPLLKDIIEYIIDTEVASASDIQRHFKIGYGRTSRILDLLEEKGLIGPLEGTKAREIYVTADMRIPEFNKEGKSYSAYSDIGFDKQPELLKEALRIFIKSGEVGCSILQRKLSIGYNKAENIIAFFEEQKFITPYFGNEKSHVLMTEEDFEKMFHETV